MYMTLKELIDKINTIPSKFGIDPEKEVVTDAWIAGRNDRQYPPGTILFECQESNIKSVMTDEDIHILSIYPHRITNLQ